METSNSEKDRKKDIKPFNIKRMVIRPTSWKRIYAHFESYGTFASTDKEQHEYCYQYTVKAIKANEFKELLLGEKEYRIWGPGRLETIATDTGVSYCEPTVMWNLLDYGIGRLYSETKDENIVMCFTKAINEMLDGEAYDVFTALYYLFQLTVLPRTELPVYDIIQSLYEKVGEYLKKYRWNWSILEEIERDIGRIYEKTGIKIQI